MSGLREVIETYLRSAKDARSWEEYEGLRQEDDVSGADDATDLLLEWCAVEIEREEAAA